MNKVLGTNFGAATPSGQLPMRVFDPICGTGTSFATVPELINHLVTEHRDCILNSAPSKSSIETQYGKGNVLAVVTSPDIQTAPVQSGYSFVSYEDINANLHFGNVSTFDAGKIELNIPNNNLSKLGEGIDQVQTVARVWYYVKSSVLGNQMNLGKVALWGGIAIVSILVIVNLTKGKKGK